jgi:hypothetical protein
MVSLRNRERLGLTLGSLSDIPVSPSLYQSLPGRIRERNVSLAGRHESSGTFANARRSGIDRNGSFRHDRAHETPATPLNLVVGAGVFLALSESHLGKFRGPNQLGFLPLIKRKALTFDARLRRRVAAKKNRSFINRIRFSVTPDRKKAGKIKIYLDPVL